MSSDEEEMIEKAKLLLSQMSVDSIRSFMAAVHITVQLEGRIPKRDLINIILEQGIDKKKMRYLVHYFKEDKKKRKSSLGVYIYRFIGDLGLDKLTELEKILLRSEYLVDFNEKDISGFKKGEEPIIPKKSKSIVFEYWYTQRRIIVDDLGNVNIFVLPQMVTFQIDLEKQSLLIESPTKIIAEKLKKTIQGILEKEGIDLRILPWTPLAEVNV